MLARSHLRGLAAVLLWITVFLPGDAQAASAPEWREAYGRFDFVTAETRLRRALVDAGRDDPGHLARLHADLGFVLFLAGKRKAAANQFLQALNLDPRVTLDEDASPTVVQEFSKVRANVARSASRSGAQPPASSSAGAPAAAGQRGSAPPGSADNSSAGAPASSVEVAPASAAEVAPASRLDLSPPPPSPDRTWLWVSAGSGVASGGAAVVLFALGAGAKKKHDAAQWADDAAAIRRSRDNLMLGSSILAAVGASLLGTALTLYLTEAAAGTAVVSATASGLDFAFHF